MNLLCMFREQHEKISDYINLLMWKSESDFFQCMRVTKKTFKYLQHCLEQTDRFSTFREPLRRPSTTYLLIQFWR